MQTQSDPNTSDSPQTSSHGFYRSQGTRTKWKQPSTTSRECVERHGSLTCENLQSHFPAASSYRYTLCYSRYTHVPSEVACLLIIGVSRVKSSLRPFPRSDKYPAHISYTLV
jgi:hypothetical protein